VHSALTGGGIWNSSAVPTGRGTVVGAVCATILLIVAMLGLAVHLKARRFATPAVATVVAGVLGLALALLSTATWGQSLTAAVPGGGLLRDGQRFLACWVLVLALGLGLAARSLAKSTVSHWRAFAVMTAVLPAVALPSLALRMGAGLSTARYPADYARVARLIDSDRRAGSAAVLPTDAYRVYPWNPSSPVRQPLTQFLDRPLVMSQDLPVAVGSEVVTVRGEDQFSSRVTRVLNSGAGGRQLAEDLGGMGVRFVVVDAPTTVDLSGLKQRFRGNALSVYEVSGVSQSGGADMKAVSPSEKLVVVVDLIVLGLLVVGLSAICLVRPRSMLGLPDDSGSLSGSETAAIDADASDR
jgi:hypothetical protein